MSHIENPSHFVGFHIVRDSILHPSSVVRRPSPVAVAVVRRPSPVARRPSPVARPPVARRPSPCPLPVVRHPSPVVRQPGDKSESVTESESE